MDRSAAARIAAHSLHATRDPRETTKAARAALDDRFLREVDAAAVAAGETLTDVERYRRAEHLRKAFYIRLAAKSAEVRRSRKK